MAVVCKHSAVSGQPDRVSNQLLASDAYEAETQDMNQQQSSQKPQRFLTAHNGFVLHITPRVKPKEMKTAKSVAPHVIYGISYVQTPQSQSQPNLLLYWADTLS